MCCSLAEILAYSVMTRDSLDYNGGYDDALFAVLGIAALLTVCFGLIAFIIGTWMKNSYVGFFAYLSIRAIISPIIWLIFAGHREDGTGQ